MFCSLPVTALDLKLAIAELGFKDQLSLVSWHFAQFISLLILAFWQAISAGFQIELFKY